MKYILYMCIDHSLEPVVRIRQYEDMKVCIEVLNEAHGNGYSIIETGEKDDLKAIAWDIQNALMLAKGFRMPNE